MNGQNNRAVGRQYEDRACAYLTEHRYHVLDRNYRTRFGEVDIVAMDPDGTIVFVEVKYRRTDHAGDPLEAVGLRKQRQICRVALWYVTQRSVSMDHQMRFDVIGIYGNGDIRHIRNAFEFVK